jgi:peptidoglycan/LPS O-acetylase OafA/YrhL
MLSTASRPRLPSLTGIRLFAALGVVGIHTGASWTGNSAAIDAAGLGYLGVPLFFLLSGYVLAWSGHSARSPAAFYRARAARYWPLHLLTFAIAVAFLPMPVADLPKLHLGGAVANVFLVQAWFPHPGIYYGANGVAWSLSCEIFFYLLFPWLDRWIARLDPCALRRLAGCVVFWMAAPVAAAHLGTHSWDQPGGVWYWLTFICPLYNLGYFVLGLLLVRLVDLRRRPRTLTIGAGVAGVLTAAVIAVLYAASAGTPSRDFVSLLVLPFLVFTMLAAAASDLRGDGFSVLRWRWVVTGGKWSFAIYLTHQLVWKQLYLWDLKIPGTSLTHHQLLPLYLAVAAIAAAAGHYLVERPMERELLRAGSGRRQAPHPPLRALPTPDVVKAA